MAVHKEISKHSQEQHGLVRNFYELDAKREKWIEVAVRQCSDCQPFEQALKHINSATDQINTLARKGIVPQRKPVTKQMVEDYCERL